MVIMNWKNIWLVWAREIRDQLRDRRMMFLFLVLPVALYPFMGMMLFQMGQFRLEHPTKVRVVGAEFLPHAPPLLVGGHFEASLFRDPPGWEPRGLESEKDNPEQGVARRMKRLVVERSTDPLQKIEELQASNQLASLLKGCDALLVFPPDFGQQIKNYQQKLQEMAHSGQAIDKAKLPKVPSPQIFYDSSKETSYTTYHRVHYPMWRWGEQLTREALGGAGVERIAFRLDSHDLASGGNQSAVWAQIFPFLLIMWGLTGAFQPSIDMVAGEKERGTLETLLCSPAKRTEIVWGKLLAVMSFSLVTVALNLLSMGATGFLILRHLPNIGSPPPLVILWMSLAAFPISALFSSLCLALAAFARSVKEGNYYLMPLLLIVLPAVVMALAPGSQINLGSSLIPVSGLVYLLRTLIEGDYQTAIPYVLPVVFVTFGCVHLSFRWAVDLFNREEVLFREAEQFNLFLWLKSLVVRRKEFPSVEAALTLCVLILLIRFMLSLVLPTAQNFSQFIGSTIALQLLVLLPTVLMGLLLTRNFRQTFRWNWPGYSQLAAAAGLAMCWHPLMLEVQLWISQVYPLDEATRDQFTKLLNGGSLPAVLFALALLPAICEEMAFRGFVLTGLNPKEHAWRAVLLSSVFFGVAHGLWQQSLVAIILGLLLAMLALRSESLWPGVLFHLCHNGLILSSQEGLAWLSQNFPKLSSYWLRHDSANELWRFHPVFTVLMTAFGVALCYFFFFFRVDSGSDNNHKYEKTPPV